MEETSLYDHRKEYSRGQLDISTVSPDPVIQFGMWMEEAIEARIDEPTAMTLATVDMNGKPSARMVLLKGSDTDGFVFFTNYSSRKGSEIAANPNVALVLYWKELERQVRIEGVAEKVTIAESDEYFRTRPPESQGGAIISPQSQVIPDRCELESKLSALLSRHKTLERPSHWGGYRVKADRIEFWQGRPGRLHDRILYTRMQKSWKIERLAP